MNLFSNSKFEIPSLLIWQLVSVYLMAVGTWPVWVAWVNVGLIILFILLRPSFEGLLLVVASIAFYVVLPSEYSDTFSMWRPVVGVLFLKAVWEWSVRWRSGRLTPPNLPLERGGTGRTAADSRRSDIDSGSSRERASSGSPPFQGGVRGGESSRLTSHVSHLFRSLLLYEKIALALCTLGILSLTLAQYPLRGASQLIFLLNTALIYPIVVWAVKSREQFIRLLKCGALSTGTIIAIGYVQFAATLFSVAYYFWQYWALRIASLYYGLPLAEVLQYSNSWVTVDGEAKVLRMFSIMTSSHGFAMVCVFFLAFALPLILKSQISKTKSQINSNAENSKSQNKRTWRSLVNCQLSIVNCSLVLAIGLACLALIFSGTRGVWAGMVPALVVAGVLYYWKRLRVKQLMAPVFAAMLVVVILFTASPLIDRGVGYIRNAGQGTLDRVVSIADTGEASNAGRLKMWKAASSYALQHPLGVGYANFVVTLASGAKDISFDEAASQDNDLYNLPQRYVTAHSLYLQVLVELSVLGLLLFGLFWLSFFYKAWQYLRSRSGLVSAETVYVATVAIIFFWFLAYSVFDVTWLNDKILLYTFVVLGLARVSFYNSDIQIDANPQIPTDTKNP